MDSQPIPVLTRSVKLDIAGRVVTAVMRHFKLWGKMEAQEDRMEAPRGREDEQAPDTISMQPVPRLTRSVMLEIPNKTVTAVMRDWHAGDSGPNGRCRLCSRCVAYADGCLVIIGRAVSREEAPMLKLDDSRSQEHVPIKMTS